MDGFSGGRSSRVVDWLKFLEGFEWNTEEERVTAINSGGNQPAAEEAVHRPSYHPLVNKI